MAISGKTNSCKVWDDQQIEQLKELVASGASPIRAAAALKRAQSSVQAKARKLGTPFMGSREAKRLRNAKIAAAEQQQGLTDR
ncbi:MULTISPECIES: hypothetical protein [Rhodopseudomonas]|uniref:GcrA cell cycle regulator n=1 Tax=Rhodopseudomonas palustris TaxID=1076 RepID=A0A0D7EIB7_RHOPL|nr:MULTISPECIES: hypothetical protein [Rhodopseudomonas]KIZ39232.1 hypothetical protein OO17_21030 [Rhodopseudomonas palustris]MDF3813198.1 hypothetical protein [Rhodopseudomonas sp. BAL398]WOK17816.1 hypothetical protein RBJ75_27500 [Rhodopseudomonas sp. BAL398]